MAQHPLITSEDFHLPGQIGRVAINVLTALQNTVVDKLDTYRYLEIGSFKGKSLLPHVLASSCKSCVSIDLRPAAAPDDRGTVYKYDHFTADMMRDSIVDSAGKTRAKKLKTITSDSSAIKTDLKGKKFDLVFIDGEHTVEGVLFDIENVRGVLAPNALVVLDDSPIVYPAVEAASYLLNGRAGPDVIYFKGSIAVILVGDLFSANDIKLPPRFWTNKQAIAEQHAQIIPS